MTPEQMQDFFNKVVGKKIKKNYWQEGYFIPLILDPLAKIICGDDYCKYICNKGVTYDIGSGFGNGLHDWIFYEENTIFNPLNEIKVNIEIERKCTCSSSDLFNYGCKCGGK